MEKLYYPAVAANRIKFGVKFSGNIDCNSLLNDQKEHKRMAKAKAKYVLYFTLQFGLAH